jgi:hypothetical protein
MRIGRWLSVAIKAQFANPPGKTHAAAFMHKGEMAHLAAPSKVVPCAGYSSPQSHGGKKEQEQTEANQQRSD